MRITGCWLISSGIRLYPHFTNPSPKLRVALIRIYCAPRDKNLFVPYRPTSRGEIGCFLGQFRIWQELIELHFVNKIKELDGKIIRFIWPSQTRFHSKWKCWCCCRYNVRIRPQKDRHENWWGGSRSERLIRQGNQSNQQRIILHCINTCSATIPFKRQLMAMTFRD